MYLFLLSFNVSIYTKERDIAIFVPLMKQRWQKHRHGIDVVPLVEYQATHGSLCLQYPRLIRVSFSYHSFLSFFHFLFTHTHPKKKGLTSFLCCSKQYYFNEMLCRISIWKWSYEGFNLSNSFFIGEVLVKSIRG